MGDEFSLIERYFAPLSNQIGDDCAILSLAAGEELAVSVDTQVEGVHFPVGAPADLVAFRAVAAALSDLAAMGASARAFTLALTLPELDEPWLTEFTKGIRSVADKYAVELIGGDTTSGPLGISVQVMGVLPAGVALRRAGAQPGDGVYVSGTPGDAAAALEFMQGRWPAGEAFEDYLKQRFYHPDIRTRLGSALLHVASSGIDVSDGLLADADHLCRASGVGIRIDPDSLPLSAALLSMSDQRRARELALAGGDDYELLFTVPPAAQSQLPAGCTRVGEVVAGTTVTCDQTVERRGYAHFSTTDRSPRPAGSTQNADSQPAVPFASLAQFFAFGFGSGLAPRAPGTCGTLLALPLYLLFAEASLPVYTAIVLVAMLLGIWLCGRASEELGVHDHPGIVWDEFVGMWITLWALPPGWPAVVLGFLVFRYFDIVKPWPISWCDAHVDGGFGIMLDDVLAGLCSCVVLHILFMLF